MWRYSHSYTDSKGKGRACSPGAPVLVREVEVCFPHTLLPVCQVVSNPQIERLTLSQVGELGVEEPWHNCIKYQAERHACWTLVKTDKHGLCMTVHFCNFPKQTSRHSHPHRREAWMWDEGRRVLVDPLSVEPAV